MKEISMLPTVRYGYDFIPPEYIPEGKNEYWLRNAQAGRPEVSWRKLKSQEIEVLVKNENYCSNWDHFLVTDPFDPVLIRNSNFYGLIRLGMLRDALLLHHDFRIPTGIRNSTIISCDIGNDAAVQDCAYISHYIIGDQVILSRIDELQTTNHAKFGNGALKKGEPEDARVWLDVMNEAGGRSILPFADMIPADAYLWGAYRDDRELMSRLMEMTQREYGGYRGNYGVIGSASVVKSCRIIKDAAIGEGAYIKGANKLKNLTIHSSETEPSQIGEGVELVNGIVGYGCHIFYGVKAVRFVIGRNCSLKYGARIVHSVLGDNSTVSCCEILNNLIFPFHEQHHNNSFLIAGLIQGMSNMAAGATIGSNHNSRANDGEIRAGRGFWPGLSVTLKHSSRFASFVLIAKGNYPSELAISLPFSLVNNNPAKDRLEVLPAYFWRYNPYTLERNSWKAQDRDKRKIKVQHIETDYLSPDTAEEIIAALSLLENWMGEAGIARGDGGSADPPEVPDPELPARGMERHDRGTVVLKPRKGRLAYREMLRYYALKTVAAHAAGHPALNFQDLREELGPIDPEDRVRDWVNLGGQIVPAFRADALRRDIREGRADRWAAVHRSYDDMAAQYPLDKLKHAWAVLYLLWGPERPGLPHPCRDIAAFQAALGELLAIQRRLCGRIYQCRAKDYGDPFRRITYRNEEEMREVAGDPEQNFFIRLSREKLARFESLMGTLLYRLKQPGGPQPPGGGIAEAEPPQRLRTQPSG